MALEDAPDRGETDARTGVFVHVMQAFKGFEDTVYVVHIETGAVIAHK